MTIHDAITRLDTLKHNTYSETEKRLWLSLLDGRIHREILMTHEGAPQADFPGYDANTPGDTVLLAEAPYDDVYIRHLEAMADYHNGEIEKYNNSVLLFDAAYKAFAWHYNRTHLPIARQWKY